MLGPLWLQINLVSTKCRLLHQEERKNEKINIQSSRCVFHECFQATLALKKFPQFRTPIEWFGTTCVFKSNKNFHTLCSLVSYRSEFFADVQEFVFFFCFCFGSGQEASGSSRSSDVTYCIELVGSCTTLVAERILAASPAVVTESVALVMLGTILLDTVNLDPAACRLAEKDREMADLLGEICGAEKGMLEMALACFVFFWYQKETGINKIWRLQTKSCLCDFKQRNPDNVQPPPSPSIWRFAHGQNLRMHFESDFVLVGMGGHFANFMIR